jgi:hypothetical protein
MEAQGTELSLQEDSGVVKKAEVGRHDTSMCSWERLGTQPGLGVKLGKKWPGKFSEVVLLS